MALQVKLFHLSALGFYLFVFNYFLSSCAAKKDTDTNVRNMERLAYRFLTNWTFLAQLVYFGLCVLVDFLSLASGTGKLRERVDQVGNALFTTIAGPMAFLVSLTFWVIYTIDRELVYPHWMDQVLPVWMNHSFHTFNSIFAIADLFLVNHKFPSYSFAAKAIATYLLAYGVCLYGTYYNIGVWIYPLLNKLSWIQQAMLCLTNIALSIVLFAVLKFLGNMLWDSKAGTKQAKPKKNARPKSKKSS